MSRDTIIVEITDITSQGMATLRFSSKLDNVLDAADMRRVVKESLMINLAASVNGEVDNSKYQQFSWEPVTLSATELKI